MAVSDITFPSSEYPAGQNTLKHYFTFNIAGDLADATTYEFQFTLPFKGRLTDVQLAADVTGTDGTDVNVDVKDDGTSVLSTKGALAVAAADESVARVGGGAATGVTHPVIDAAKDSIAEDSKIEVAVQADGTFTTQPANAVVVLEFTEEQNTDPAT